MLGMREKSVCLLPGEIVEVRPWKEVRETLDANGMLEGLPFMPEMVHFWGWPLVVSKRLESMVYARNQTGS